MAGRMWRVPCGHAQQTTHAAPVTRRSHAWGIKPSRKPKFRERLVAAPRHARATRNAVNAAHPAWRVCRHVVCYWLYTHTSHHSIQTSAEDPTRQCNLSGLSCIDCSALPIPGMSGASTTCAHLTGGKVNPPPPQQGPTLALLTLYSPALSSLRKPSIDLATASGNSGVGRTIGKDLLCSRMLHALWYCMCGLQNALGLLSAIASH